MPYTSRDEITTAVQTCIRNANSRDSEEPYDIRFIILESFTSLLSRYITEKDIDAQLLTSLGGSPPLDILIRTSGVKRLSDFMLWQVSFYLHNTFFFESRPERCCLVLRRYPTPILVYILARFRAV